MNRAGRWLAGLVCAASLCGAPAVAQAATPRPRLLVVAVPGLLWSDVASMPALAHYVSTAADADLSVRSQASTTRCADGLLTLSAGARTGGAGSACTVSSFAALARRDAGSGFTAHLGAFGQSLHNAGLRTAALDPAARLVIGDAHGQVDVVTTDVRGALSRADVVAAVVPSLYAASGPRRPAARHAADSAIRALLAAAPPAVAAAVVGASDAASGRSRLHVLALRGPSWQPGTLTSIRRASYVQLVDVAATLLHGIGVAPAATLGGRTAIASGPHPARIATLVDNDLHAWRAAQLSSPLRTVLWSTTMGLAVLWLAATRWPRLSGAARWSASLLAFAPVSTYLPQLVPWWRHGVAAYLVLLVSCTVALAVLAQLGSRRLRSASTALLAAGFTWVVLVVDQLAHARLQFSAPLGDNPIVAGRFRGMGNIDFAVTTASAVVFVGLLAVALHRRSQRFAATAAAVGVALVTLAVDGLPMLGDDLGGMLTLVPALVILVAGAGLARLSRRKIAALAVAAAAVVVAVAVADYLRPASARTHVGQFVGQVLHGGAGAVLSRKARAAARSLANVPALLSALFVASAAVWSRARLWSRPEPIVLRSTALALLVLAVVGSAVNDSGTVVAAFVAVTAGPLLALESLPEPDGVSRSS